MKKFVYGLFTLIFLSLILIFPTQSIEGAKYGLLLWFNVIIPSLLPFIIISNIIIALNIIPYFTLFIFPIMNKIFKISKYGTYAVITGFLFGYPMGAKVTSDLRSNGLITQNEAMYLMTFCNNVSPVFIINYIVYQTLKKPELAGPTIGILFASSIICGLIFKKSYVKKDIVHNTPKLNIDKNKNLSFSILDKSICSAIETIVRLGGYLIIFGIISNMITLLPVSDSIKPLLTGFIEITNGINSIGISSATFYKKYIYIIICVAFGGLSSVAQTSSFLSSVNIPVSKYFFAKIINTVISFFLTLLYLFITVH